MHYTWAQVCCRSPMVPKSRDESLELAHSLFVGSCSDPAPNLSAMSAVIFGRATNTARSENPPGSVREELNG